MKSLQSISLILILLLSVSITTAVENQSLSGGDTDISIGYSDDTLLDFIKRMFSTPFSTVGAQTNIWVASGFTIGEFSTVRIDISNEKYTYNQGDNFKILAFFTNPRGANIRVKIFKLDKANNNNQILMQDTGNYRTASDWTWAYWMIPRSNEPAGTYVINSYLNDNLIRTKTYVVKPQPPTFNLAIDSTYQATESIPHTFTVTKGSVNVKSYCIEYGDGNDHCVVLNGASDTAQLTHIYNNEGSYDVIVKVIDSELIEYTLIKKVDIVLAGIYDENLLQFDTYNNMDTSGKTNIELTLNPNLDRHYIVKIDDNTIFTSTGKISTPQNIIKSLDLELGKHQITAGSSYNGISYIPVFEGDIYVRYIPLIDYISNYQDTITGTLEHNDVKINTDILLYKNGNYESKTNTVNGYFIFSNLENGVYNIVFMGNNEYVDVMSTPINIGDTSGIDVKTINLNDNTLKGFFISLIDWLKWWN